MKTSLKIGFFLLSLFVLLLCCGWFEGWLNSPSTLQSLDIGNGGRIDIVVRPVDHGFDGFAILYEIKTPTHYYPPSYFGDPVRPKGKAPFGLLSLNDGKLVAVYQKTHPLVLHVICDLESGDVWPRGHVTNEIGDRLIKRIRDLTGNNTYTYEYYMDLSAVKKNE